MSLMQDTFLVISGIGLFYFLFGLRKFDFFSVAFLSACVYFLPGFVGYTVTPFSIVFCTKEVAAVRYFNDFTAFRLVHRISCLTCRGNDRDIYPMAKSPGCAETGYPQLEDRVHGVDCCPLSLRVRASVSSSEAWHV